MPDPIEREVELQHSKGRMEQWKPEGLQGLSVVLPATVYPPRDDTRLLDECVASLGPGEGGKLLELGSGSGVISIASALRGWQVTCCDVNPLAVAAARGNAEAAAVDIEVIEGGLDESGELQLDGPFDVIVWNLPYLQPPEKGGARLGPLEDAGLVDLPSGTGWGARLLATLEENPQLLTDDGLVLLLHTNNERGNSLQSNWLRQGWATRHVADKRLGGDERLTCFAAWKPFRGRALEVRDSVDSTNRRLLDEFGDEVGGNGGNEAEGGDEVGGNGGNEAEGGDEGRGLVAAEQTAGRGQRQRSWTTQLGDFAGSWVIHQPGEPGDLQIHAAVAVADSIACLLEKPLPSAHWTNAGEVVSAGLEVRWPNDLWFEGGKLAGVLVEGRQQGAEQRVVLGIGVNLCSRESSDYPSSSLEELLGRQVSVADFTLVMDASVASHFERKSRLGLPCNPSRRRQYWALLSGHLRGGAKLLVEGRSTIPFGLTEGAELITIDSGDELMVSSSYERSWK
jgi:biotin-(acetyl-CoA carboxylase) ligase/methylase of polypeptide subunit release factors